MLVAATCVPVEAYADHAVPSMSAATKKPCSWEERG